MEANDDPEAVAQRQLEAYNRHDADAFAACFAENARVQRMPGMEVLAEGRPAIRALYAALFQREPERRVELENRIVSGQYVVDHETVTGVPDRSERSAVAIYEIEGGLVRRVWFPPVADL